MGIMYLLAGVCALALLRGSGARWHAPAAEPAVAVADLG